VLKPLGRQSLEVLVRGEHSIKKKKHRGRLCFGQPKNRTLENATHVKENGKAKKESYSFGERKEQDAKGGRSIVESGIKGQEKEKLAESDLTMSRLKDKRELANFASRED